MLCFFLLLLSATALEVSGSRIPHSYPRSTGYSGSSSCPRSTGYSGNSFSGGSSYPHSNGYSGTSNGGSHSYPRAPALSGNSNSYKHPYHSKTEVHHHYHYSPPRHISYGSTHYPVYHGTPPVYIYEYKNSGSRFDNLLTGLALYNLGRISAHHHNSYYDTRREYSGSQGEICKLGISKRSGIYEETRIDCKLMSSFIWDASQNARESASVSSKSVSTTVTNSTTSGNTTVTTVKVYNETVTDALKSRGPSIAVTPGMTCSLIRIFHYSTVKKDVDCALLDMYARSSIHSGSERLKTMTLQFALCTFVLYNR